MKKLLAVLALCIPSLAFPAQLTQEGCDSLAVHVALTTSALQTGETKPPLYNTSNKEIAELAETLLRVVLWQLKATPEITPSQMGLGFQGFCYKLGGDVDYMNEILKGFLFENDV